MKAFKILKEKTNELISFLTEVLTGSGNLLNEKNDCLILNVEFEFPGLHPVHFNRSKSG